MILKEKSFITTGGKLHRVLLRWKEGIFIVVVDKEVFKETANELFAVQTFNSI